MSERLMDIDVATRQSDTEGHIESGLLPESDSAWSVRTMRSVYNGSRRQRRLTQGGTSHARPQSQAGRTDSGAAL